MICFWYAVFDDDNIKEGPKMFGKGWWYVGNHEEFDEQKWRIPHSATFHLRRDGVEYDLRAINGGLST